MSKVRRPPGGVTKRGMLLQQVDQLSRLYETVDKLTVKAKSQKKPVVQGVKGAGAKEVASALDGALKARSEVKRSLQTVRPPPVEVKSKRLNFNYEHQPVDRTADEEQARLKKELLLRKIEREQMDRDGPDDELQRLEIQRSLEQQMSQQGYDYGQSYTPPYTPPNDYDQGY